MKKRKIFFVTGIVLIVFIAIIAGSVLKTTGGNDENKSGSHDVSISGNNEIEFPVKAAVVRKGNLIVWINTSGYAYPVREYEIEPKISGLVTELNSFNGKLVKKGDLLFKLNNAQYKLDVSQAKSELIKSQIEYELQKANSEVGSGGLSKYRLQLDSIKVIYERAKESYNKNKISYEDYSRIERDYETLKTIATLNREDVVASRSGLTNAATNYKKAELNMSHTKYEAPISGLVADCNISKGSYLNIGESSLKVIDISSIKIRCEVTESDLVKITTDEPVEAEFVALPGKKFKGKVIEVNPSVDLTKRTALITVLLKNPGLIIKPGMFASVKIGTQNYSDRIIIPHTALLARENRTLVFTVDKGIALWKYVTLGNSNERYYEIKSGLSAGDTLIIGGNYNLAHQSRVKITSILQY